MTGAVLAPVASLCLDGDPLAFSHEAHRAMLEDFLDAVTEPREPRLSGASALRVHRFIDQLLESAASRAVVTGQGPSALTTGIMALSSPMKRRPVAWRNQR